MALYAFNHCAEAVVCVQPHYRYIPLRDFRRADLELYEKLGSGSFGSVYRCSMNGFTCAVKIMSLGMALLAALNLGWT